MLVIKPIILIIAGLSSLGLIYGDFLHEKPHFYKELIGSKSQNNLKACLITQSHYYISEEIADLENSYTEIDRLVERIELQDSIVELKDRIETLSRELAILEVDAEPLLENGDDFLYLNQEVSNLCELKEHASKLKAWIVSLHFRVQVLERKLQIAELDRSDSHSQKPKFIRLADYHPDFENQVDPLDHQLSKIIKSASVQ
ncbi:MAG: hypothetical protein SFT81_06260 [Candidatus Caenarcaniphilales bacterium]|nr:hypothetical protein [Candidatus Caenarcaniphilales bacterium]